MARARDLGRFAFAGAFAVVGLLHFLSPRVFVEHLPAQVPARLPIVYATGALEIVLAAAFALARPAQRRRIGLVTAAYLIAVFPANIYVAVAGVPVYPAPWLAWARLPLQPLFVWWVLSASGSASVDDRARGELRVARSDDADDREVEALGQARE